ncbi:class I SAM-dependent methyltransferase [Erythrobacter sp. EC-HK427]|uniref:class I SAM-dependent methyltransferase n=1 Tax=Erythrobacter sp. EC-HK427 TaxID=2038396 RepID=UPI00125C519E|nr:class I SAM-dependent methyltransferase [Erythrobacter sp. EC-HK427]VVT13810.1 conserved hypothetical protein [Erythrobacter sp. EC-HK427]
MAKHDQHSSHTAWNAFWAQNAASPAGSGGGCLPAASPGIDRVQAKAWASFAAKLPRAARVLDLATGDGRVMQRLLDARRDLKPVGIDLATTLPPAPRGTKLRGGVLMHDLPFPDGSFAAVTSQFGFEYGDMQAIAAEIARVLRPGGWLGLITHRIDGPILSHNLRRREQIDWAVAAQDLPGKAKNSLRLRAIGVGSLPEELATAPERGAREFGPQSAAWEIAEAIRQTLVHGKNEPPMQTAAVIDRIVAQAQNELGRIASLEAAAQAAGTGEPVAAVLTAAGLRPIASEMLHDAGPTGAGAPFATFLTFQKPA